MRCAKCDTDNGAGMKFCGQCGSPLGSACPGCGFQNPPEFKFCGQCGLGLGAAAESAGPKTAARAAPASQPPGVRALEAEFEGERRQLTVMFCDVVGSTALSELLDPEELRDVMIRYQEMCGEIIGRFEAHIAKYLGDGILVYFGFPRAHEDDALRAVRAGLEIVGGVPALNARLNREHPERPPMNLQLRVGIHTGLVVVGAVGGSDYREQGAVVGETPNIAARLQDLAEPGTVVVSGVTRQLLRGNFEFQDQGSHQLKGITRAIGVYRAIGEASGRRGKTGTRVISPLIGRESEARELIEAWEKARRGERQVALISGEAGIGKSRLLHALQDHLDGAPHALLDVQGSSYCTDSALYPIIDLLQRVLEIGRDDGPEERLVKLESFLNGYERGEDLGLFAALLSIARPGGKSISEATPERQKRETLRALEAVICRMAELQPLVVQVEDLHWVDPSTLELIRLLVEGEEPAPLLLVMTFRPSFVAPWGTRPNLRHIALNKLTRNQIKTLVEEVTGGKALPAEVMGEILVKTDGVPLFVEELTKMVIESDLLREREDRFELKGPLKPLEIPATLQDSLMARLDRLPTVKRIAQLGAALGREFAYDLIKAVSPIEDEAQLREELNRLVEAEVFYQRGRPPDSEYIFRHALIQETAYQSLLKRTRQQYHKKIAEAMRERFPKIAELQPELLANHYTQAGMREDAVKFWQKAGRRALDRSAHLEAVSQFTKALDLVKAMPTGPERVQAELVLQSSLGLALMSTRGYGAAEVERAYTRAMELCQQVGHTPHVLPVKFGLWGYYLLRAELDAATELGKQCMAQAEMAKYPYLLEQANFTMGMTLFWLGELDTARAHFENGIRQYDENYRKSHVLPAIQDPSVGSRAVLALVLWLMGEPEKAYRSAQDAIALAEDLRHPFSQAFAASFTCLLYQLAGNLERTAELTHQSMDLCSEQSFSFYLSMAIILQGWSMTLKQSPEEGIERIAEGLATYRETGAKLGRPYFLALLAEAHGRRGQPERGLEILEKATKEAVESRQLYYEAELYRFRGDLLLRLNPDDVEGAGEAYERALETARRQKARSLELRAAIALAPLLVNLQRKDEARGLLRGLNEDFGEANSSPDLTEARRLLQSLA